MKKKTLSLAAFAALLTCGSAIGQNCDTTISDEAGLLGSKGQAVEAAANKLNNDGADVRIRTVNSLAGAATLDSLEKSLEQSCPSWQSPNGGRKNNLIALMITKKERKLGLYFGSEWKAPLEGNWQRIRTDYMTPLLKRDDYAGGFIAGLEHFDERIAAFNHEAVQPQIEVVQQPTVPSQPTDYSGLWTVLKWCLGLVVLGGLGRSLWVLLSTRKNDKEQRVGAKRKAVLEQQQCADLITKLNTDFSEFEILNPDKKDSVARAKGLLDVASASYSRISGSPKGDPTADGLMASEYDSLSEQYCSIKEKLQEAERIMSGGDPKVDLQDKPRQQQGSSRRERRNTSYYRPDPPVQPAPAAQAPSPAVREVVYERPSSYSPTIIAPVIIENEREPEYRRSAPSESWSSRDSSRSDPVSAPAKKSGDDSGFGSSSSFSSKSDDNDKGFGGSNSFDTTTPDPTPDPAPDAGGSSDF